MKTVAAQFASSVKKYHYLVRPGDEPAIGDLLVTSIGGGPSKWGNEEGTKLLNIAQVVEIFDEKQVLATKFYLQLISRQSLIANEAENRELIEQEQLRVAKERERKQVLARLRELAESRELINQFKGSDDPEIRELIEKLS